MMGQVIEIDFAFNKQLREREQRGAKSLFGPQSQLPTPDTGEGYFYNGKWYSNYSDFVDAYCLDVGDLDEPT